MKLTCPILPLERIFNKHIEKQRQAIGGQSEQSPLREKSHAERLKKIEVDPYGGRNSADLCKYQTYRTTGDPRRGTFGIGNMDV